MDSDRREARKRKQADAFFRYKISGHDCMIDICFTQQRVSANETALHPSQPDHVHLHHNRIISLI